MTSNESRKSWWLPSWVSLAVMVTSALVLFAVDDATSRSMLADNGFTQILNASVIAASVLLCLQRALRKLPPALAWAELSIIALAYMLREMDFHRMFTGEHVTRLRLYTEDHPLQQKLVAGPIVAFATLVLLHFLWRNLGHLVRSLKARQSWAVHACIWFFLGALSQSVDKNDLINAHVDAIIEENLELGAAVMFFLLLLKNPWRAPAEQQP